MKNKVVNAVLGISAVASVGVSGFLYSENVNLFFASTFWTKLQSLDWQLSCQPHSHCRPYLVVTA